MQSATSPDEFRSLVDKELDFRFECGYPKATNKLMLSDKQQLMRALWLHYVFFLAHAELEQLQKGFRETLQLESLISTYPEQIHCFLVASTTFDVTPDYLLDNFIIKYSEPGSNRRTKEEALMLYWTEYILESARE